jgi:RecA-family ATPase
MCVCGYASGDSYAGKPVCSCRSSKPITPTVLASILSFLKEHDVKLVLADTLAAFWRIENENDAAEMTKVVKPLLQLARESGACVLLNYHARKSEGSYGDEIRGSGALFALVDVAILMKRT